MSGVIQKYHVSKNLFDVEFEQGSLNTGASAGTTLVNMYSPSDLRIRAKTLLKVEGLGTITISFNAAKYEILLAGFTNENYYDRKSTDWLSASTTYPLSGFNSNYIDIIVRRIGQSEISPDITDLNLMINTGSPALPYEPFETENLWGGAIETNKYIDGQGNTGTASNGDIFDKKGITVVSSTNYTFSWSDVVLGSEDNTPYIRICFYTSNGGTFISRTLVTPSSYPDKYVTFTTPNNCTYVDIRIDSETSTRGQHFENLMLNIGSTPLPYTPYGTIWKDASYTRLETATDTITALPVTIYTDTTSVPSVNLFDDHNVITVPELGDRYGVELPSGTYSIYNDTGNRVFYGTNDFGNRQIACEPHSTATITLTIATGTVGGVFMPYNSASQGGCTVVSGSTPPDHYIPYTSYTIKGNMSQLGTPTPTTPIIPQECGERTENLFSENYPNITSSVQYTSIYVGDGDFTLSTTTPAAGQTAVLFLLAGNVASGASTVTNGVWDGQTRTVTAVSGYVTIAYRAYPDVSPENYQTMLNTGSTAKTYEPYGYKLPIISGGVTTNAYLGEVQSTRRIKKKALTGSEDWQYNQGPDAENGYYFIDLGENIYVESTDCICSHFEYASISVTNTIDGFRITNKTTPYAMKALLIRCKDISMSSDPTAFKQWLYNQYSAGTPVTVWYLLETKTTAIVNEPIRKIGDYVDTVTNPVSIPTTSGGQTFNVDTTLKPSEVDLTYHGWHEHEAEKYSRTENLFDTFDIVGKVPSINNGELVDYAGSTCTPIAIQDGDITITVTNWSITVYLLLYDVNMSYIGYLRIDNSNPYYGTAITGYANAKYCRVRIESTSGLENVKIMLNTGSTAKPYQPYLDWE